MNVESPPEKLVRDDAIAARRYARIAAMARLHGMAPGLANGFALLAEAHAERAGIGDGEDSGERSMDTPPTVDAGASTVDLGAGEG